MVTRLGWTSRASDSLREVDVGTERHESAHFVLSTAHKAKGLEFSDVLLWYDFLDTSRVHRDGDRFVTAAFDSWSDSVTTEEVDADEINLVYVAATRAMRRLIVYPGLAKLRAEEGHADPPPCAPYHSRTDPVVERRRESRRDPLLAEVNDARVTDRERSERVGATRCARCDRTGGTSPRTIDARALRCPVATERGKRERRHRRGSVRRSR